MCKQLVKSVVSSSSAVFVDCFIQVFYSLIGCKQSLRLNDSDFSWPLLVNSISYIYTLLVGTILNCPMNVKPVYNNILRTRLVWRLLRNLLMIRVVFTYKRHPSYEWSSINPVVVITTGKVRVATDPKQARSIPHVVQSYRVLWELVIEPVTHRNLECWRNLTIKRHPHQTLLAIFNELNVRKILKEFFHRIIRARKACCDWIERVTGFAIN